MLRGYKTNAKFLAFVFGVYLEARKSTLWPTLEQTIWLQVKIVTECRSVMTNVAGGWLLHCGHNRGGTGILTRDQQPGVRHIDTLFKKVSEMDNFQHN